MYGEDYATYGSGLCAHCNKIHEKPGWIQESGESRFKLLQFSAELATIDKAKDVKLTTSRQQGFRQKFNVEVDKLSANPLPELLVDAETNAKLGVFTSQLAKSPYKIKAPPTPPTGISISVTSPFNQTSDYDPGKMEIVDGRNMLGELAAIQEEASRKDWYAMLGLLMTPEGTYVAAAGTFEGITAGLFAYVAKKLGYKTCDKNKKGDTPSVGGAMISKQLYEGAKVDNVAGTCAAPKLIQQYIADRMKVKGKIDVSTLHMSEIYFVPNTETHTAKTQSQGGLYWTPGLTAHSCETCQKLLPMLLCPSDV